MFKSAASILAAILLLVILTSAAAAQESSAELTFEPESYGRTIFKVLEPEGAVCNVAEGGLSTRYTVPFSAPAAEHSFYAFTCKLPNGSEWTKTLEPRPRQVNIIRVKAGAATAKPAPVAESPKAPTALDAASFNNLLSAIKRESFGDDKLRVIQSAAANGHFTIAQVGQIVQTLSFGEEKVNAVRALKPRVIDPQNAYQLQSLFSFSSEKEEVQQIFAR